MRGVEELLRRQGHSVAARVMKKYDGTAVRGVRQIVRRLMRTLRIYRIQSSVGRAWIPASSSEP